MTQDAVGELVRDVRRLAVRVVGVVVHDEPSLAVEHRHCREDRSPGTREVADGIGHVGPEDGERQHGDAEVPRERPRAQRVVRGKAELGSELAGVGVRLGLETTAVRDGRQPFRSRS